MKLIIIIASVLTFLSNVYGDTQVNVRKQTLSLDSIHLPHVRHVTLANGLTIYLKKTHDLPLIRMTAHFGIGLSSNPSAKYGLTTLLRTLIRRDLFRQIRKINGYVNLKHPLPKIYSSESHDISSIEIDGIYDLSDTSSRRLFKRTCQSFAKALFSTDITKNRVLANKRHLLKQLGIWVNKPDLYIKHLARYHLNDPDFTPNTYIQAVKKIGLNDVLNVYRTYIKPNTTVLTVTGSFNIDNMISILKGPLNSWEKSEVSYPKTPKIISEQTFTFIPRNSVQTYVYLGASTFKCPHSDYITLILANYILGQMVHTNRLYREIRSEQGLVYSIQSRLRMSPFGKGTLEILFYCKPKKVIPVINRVTQTLQQFINGPISAHELLQAKHHYIFSCPGQVNSSRRYLNTFAKHKLLGFPPHFNYNMIERLKTISQKDILEVARKYFSPKRFTIILSGKKLNWNNPKLKAVIQARRFIKN